MNIAPLFLKLSTSWRVVVNFVRQPLYPEPCPLHTRLDVLRSRPGNYGKEENLFPLLGIEIHTVQLVAWPLPEPGPSIVQLLCLAILVARKAGAIKKIVPVFSHHDQLNLNFLRLMG